MHAKDMEKQIYLAEMLKAKIKPYLYGEKESKDYINFFFGLCLV